MHRFILFFNGLLAIALAMSCTHSKTSLSADELLGNAKYQAVAYGGYRNPDRAQAPTVQDIKEDLRLLHAMDIHFLRTYHARLYGHAENVLKAIAEIKAHDPDFEMYVMLGAWMQCQGAWTKAANHAVGDSLNNAAEIAKATELAASYPNIVKIIAVGNESMVHWAASYYVKPEIITVWVKHLQEQKSQGVLPASLWVTSSDNYASWGGEANYRGEALEELIEAVDYISLHSYPFHDTHYNSAFWYVPEKEENLDKKIIINRTMERAVDRVEGQVAEVKRYLEAIGSEKEIHLGETGWASADNSLYGASGSRAADEYKQHLYYQKIRSWCDSMGMSCFYFEAFDEPWKDQENAMGSENHFGLFDVQGHAKLPLHAELENHTFKNLGRNGSEPAISTRQGNRLLEQSLLPPFKSSVPVTLLEFPKDTLDAEISSFRILPIEENSEMNYPAVDLKITGWDGTCQAYADKSKSELTVIPGNGPWWGAALETQGAAMNLGEFRNGILQYEMKSSSANSTFELGMLSGNYGKGTQQRAGITFGNQASKKVATEWKNYSIAIATLVDDQFDLEDITAPLFLAGENSTQGDTIHIRKLRFSKQ